MEDVKIKSLKVNEAFELKLGGSILTRDNFDYLPWAAAWKEVLKLFPDATYDIERDENKIPCFGNSTIGYICYTTVTIAGVTRPMHLPVLNKKKPILNPDMFQINTAVMRCLVKNIAMFGIGIDLYIGEDVPEEKKEELQSYDKNNKDTEFKDPFDGPGIKSEELPVIKDDSKTPVKKKSTEAKPSLRQVSTIDKKFEEALKKQGCSAKKIKEHLSNSKINDTLKKSVIDGKLKL